MSRHALRLTVLGMLRQRVRSLGRVDCNPTSGCRGHLRRAPTRQNITFPADQVLCDTIQTLRLPHPHILGRQILFRQAVQVQCPPIHPAAIHTMD